MFTPPEVILRPLVRKALNGLPRRRTSVGQLQHYCPKLYRNLTNEAKNTYKSAFVKELGKPLQICSIPKKTQLNSNEVRVRVHAAGINFADILLAQGTYQVKPPLPFCPGAEVAGVIDEVGQDVRRVKQGTRVLTMLSSGIGGFSEEVVLNESEVYEIPDKMSFPEAAALLCSYGTAITALEKKAMVKPGDTVLVTAAAGGIGLATTDLATNVFQAKVVGAAGSAEKCEIVKSYGAEHVINYNQQDLRNEVRNIYPKGVNIAIDPVGGDAFKNCFRSLAPEGRLVVIGFASGNIPTIQANHLLVKNVSVIGLYWGGQAFYNYDALTWSALECIKHFKNGKIKPHIGATFPLEKINEALQFVQSRKSCGKVIITM